MEDDEEAGDDCPEDSGGLVGDGAAFDVLAVGHVFGGGGALGGFERVDCLDVVDHDEDRGGEDENKRDETEDSDGIQAKKEHCRGCWVSESLFSGSCGYSLVRVGIIVIEDRQKSCLVGSVGDEEQRNTRGDPAPGEEREGEESKGEKGRQKDLLEGFADVGGARK